MSEIPEHLVTAAARVLHDEEFLRGNRLHSWADSSEGLHVIARNEARAVLSAVFTERETVECPECNGSELPSPCWKCHGTSRVEGELVVIGWLMAERLEQVAWWNADRGFHTLAVQHGGPVHEYECYARDVPVYRIRERKPDE